MDGPLSSRRPWEKDSLGGDLRKLLSLLPVGLLWVGGCAAVPPPIPPTNSPTRTPVTATIAFPTLRPSGTPSPIPTGSPTPDVLSGVGPLIFRDDFSFNEGWVLGESPVGAISIFGDRLILAVRQARQFQIAVRHQPPLGSFYAEAEVRTELCSSGDEFGFVFRVNGLGEHYRFTLSCDGLAQVRRVLETSSRALVSPEVSAAAFAGAPALNRMAIWANGDRFRFYVNGVEILHARDGSLPGGRIGFTVRSGRSGQTTISFDNLTVRELLPPSP